MRKTVAILAVVLALAGCGGGESAPAATQTPTPSAPPSRTYADGDAAACKAYGRVGPKVSKFLLDIIKTPLPTSVMAGMFAGWADDIESGMVAASDKELAAGASGVTKALRSMAATTRAWKPGEKLDLLSEVSMLTTESQKIAGACRGADPAAVYTVITV